MYVYVCIYVCVYVYVCMYLVVMGMHGDISIGRIILECSTRKLQHKEVNAPGLQT